MKAIGSLEEYKETVRGFKAQREKVDSNCFLMSGSLTPYIQDGRMFVHVFPDGIVFYLDEGSFYESFFFWDQSAPFSDFRAEKAVSVTLIPSLLQRGNATERINTKLLASGFRFFKKTCQLDLDVKKQWELQKTSYQAMLCRVQSDGLILHDPVPARLAERVISLWTRELDITDIPVGHLDFLMKPEDTAICLTDSEDRVVCAYWWHRAKSSAEGRHIVTDPDYTRRGLASLLLLHCIKSLAEEDVFRLTTFVSEDNTRSLLLHEKNGFQRKEKTVLQYLV